MSGNRLLYLGFALPPGGRTRHPGINPAGNAFEVQMITALRAHFEIRSVGCLPFPMPPLPGPHDPASGLAHDLMVVEQAPELWHRARALAQLKTNYRAWQKAGWLPEAVLVYNFSPIYNQFIRWLRRQTAPPKLVLLLLDSSQLGQELSASKRLRYRFKPFATLDEAMLNSFDACIGLSTEVEKYAAPHKLKFLWMPGACTPARAPQNEPAEITGPARFCYFGALAAHAGVMELLKVFLATPGESELHIAGYGKSADEIREIAKNSSRIKFHGLLPRPEDCLQLGRACDVLVNPRPPGHGNENNVPSKLFDYALCGRAILSSRMSGIENVFGPEAFYFEVDDFAANLRAAILRAAETPRHDLQRRGEAISRRVKTEFNWERQAARMAEFLREI